MTRVLEIGMIIKWWIKCAKCFRGAIWDCFLSAMKTAVDRRQVHSPRVSRVSFPINQQMTKHERKTNETTRHTQTANNTLWQTVESSVCLPSKPCRIWSKIMTILRNPQIKFSKQIKTVHFDLFYSEKQIAKKTTLSTEKKIAEPKIVHQFCESRIFENRLKRAFFILKSRRSRCVVQSLTVVGSETSVWHPCLSRRDSALAALRVTKAADRRSYFRWLLVGILWSIYELRAFAINCAWKSRTMATVCSLV